MRKPTIIEVERGRLAGPSGEPYGIFIVKVGIFRLRCVAACGQGWDHVSVSLDCRCPTWAEMDAVKRMFWHDHEVVMQLHINDERKVNTYQYVLHLWRPQTKEESEAERQHWAETGEPSTDWNYPAEIPLPPKGLV